MKLKIKNSTSLRFPIYLTLLYLIATLIIYVLCPYNWPTKMPWLFYTLNILYIGALVGGYFFGQKHRLSLGLIAWDEKKTDLLCLILSIASILNFLVYVVTIFRSYGLSSLDFPRLFTEMGKGLRNPGYGYYLNNLRQQQLEGSGLLGGTLFTLFNLGWSFLKNPIIILSMLYFKRLKVYGKLFTVSYLALVVIYYISIGTNIQFLHVILLILLPVLLEVFDLWHAGQMKPKKLIKPIVLTVTCFALLAGYFGYMIQSRFDRDNGSVEDYVIGGIAIEPEEPTEPAENPEDKPTTPAPSKKPANALEKLWISGSSYLTQGYYGMSMALGETWTPMFGIGNSMFLVNLISGNLYDVDQFTYQVKLEKYGWDSDVRWHSIYTWIANDVSFYGVIVVMALIGLLFGMMFKDAIQVKNPFARAAVFFFILMMLFIPCNNQVGQTADNLLGFLTLIGLWLICKKDEGVPCPETN